MTCNPVIDDCCICLSPIKKFDKIIKLQKCGHQFHAPCYDNMINHIAVNPTNTHSITISCPLCRASYTINSSSDVVSKSPSPICCPLPNASCNINIFTRRVRHSRRCTLWRKSIHSKLNFILYDLSICIFSFIIMRIIFPCRRTTQNWLKFQFICDGGSLLIIISIFYVFHIFRLACRN